MGQKITSIMSSMTYNIDKDIFEQQMESKLDKDEYFQHRNKETLGNESIKQMEHNLSKCQKKLDKLSDSLKSKLKNSSNRLKISLFLAISIFSLLSSLKFQSLKDIASL